MESSTAPGSADEAGKGERGRSEAPGDAAGGFTGTDGTAPDELG